ncbi:hypothetical protein DOE51_08650 [Bdellovibrio sp. NC01]|nr:hypothetical protein DOE51_08650 [Bdellovibrio sp. NC01]
MALELLQKIQVLREPQEERLPLLLAAQLTSLVVVAAVALQQVVSARWVLVGLLLRQLHRAMFLCTLVVTVQSVSRHQALVVAEAVVVLRDLKAPESLQSPLQMALKVAMVVTAAADSVALEPRVLKLWVLLLQLLR